MNALILCAGLGTRFMPHTARIPKPAIPFLNVPLMAYSTYYLDQVGVRNIAVNTHHLPQVIENVAGRISANKNFKIRFSPEPGQILGSGGGIRRAEMLLNDDENFVVMNGDEVLLFEHSEGLRPLIEYHKKEKALVTMLTTKHPEAGMSLGGVWSEKGVITRLGERGLSPEDAKGAEHFTGIYVFSKRIFNFMPESGNFHIFKDCMIPAIKKGEKIMSFLDEKILWLDSTSERDYLKSTKEALENLRDRTPFAKNLLNLLRANGQNIEQTGETKWFGKDARFSGDLDSKSLLFLGEHAHIEDGVAIKGFAVMGDYTLLKQGYIENSVVATGVKMSEPVALRKQLILE